MHHAISRRGLASALGAGFVLGLPRGASSRVVDALPGSFFPAQDPERVRLAVLHAHSDIEALGEQLAASPALANAAIDWGFGDWESAIGAAGHMGRADIARLLLDHGARPDLYTHAMLGHLDVVRATVERVPGVQGTLGPHGITLMAHARAGGEAARDVVRYLQQLGGADPAPARAELAAPPEAFVGTYAWGDEEGQRFSIDWRRGDFYFDMAGDFPRLLIAAGTMELAPRAAPAVRLSFTLENGRAVATEVRDHDLRLRARRTP